MDTVMEAVGLSKTFGNGVRAVDDVSLRVEAGQTVGIVGESGCGKSTTAKMLLRLLDADSGTVAFEGANITRARGKALRSLRSRLQVVPQNPQTSLNPRRTIGDSVEFNMRVHGVARTRRREKMRDLLARVGLDPSYATRYPHELSGGQLQRVAIARALSTEPSLVVCDEPVSALDKSVQAQVLNLLADLQREMKVAYLFISHDLGVVEHLADRVLVMYLGRVVEDGAAGALWSEALHPYTRALLSAAPGRDQERVVLRGELPSPRSLPTGCAFRTRCPEAESACAQEIPQLISIGGDPTPAAHRGACVHIGQVA
ncbi:MAG TPA: oligopeptide/dipeptide ABC transporter ATP-binding protein [Mycobacteriales bacterium]|jgi:oligopeptide/dipeptide ABC transporter ATP-binding protein|nr:oligopeptide/dipeptide ABC transporter ATP-binding protein [Mycobacteriales bacterium]